MSERQVIGHGQCSACKGRVEIRLNRNRIAYYFCTAYPENRPCSHHEKWGRADSNRMIAAAAAAARKAPAPANDNPPPEPKPDEVRTARPDDAGAANDNAARPAGGFLGWLAGD